MFAVVRLKLHSVSLFSLFSVSFNIGLSDCTRMTSNSKTYDNSVNSRSCKSEIYTLQNDLKMINKNISNLFHKQIRFTSLTLITFLLTLASVSNTGLTESTTESSTSALATIKTSAAFPITTLTTATLTNRVIGNVLRFVFLFHSTVG